MLVYVGIHMRGIGSAGGSDVDAHGLHSGIQRIMRAVAGGKVVIAGFQHPGSVDAVMCIGPVIGIEVFSIKGDFDFFALAGGQQNNLGKVLFLCFAGLGIAQELDGALFHMIVAVALGIGDGYIQLHTVLGCLVAGVGDLHGCGRGGGAGPVNAQIRDFLREGGAFQAVAEGIADLGIIIPGGAVDALAFRGLSSIALLEHHVKIAGFIVLVSGINAFEFGQIPGRAKRVVVALVDIACVFKDINAVVLSGRAQSGIDGEGIRQMAAGQHRTGQQLCDAVGAVCTGIADPEDGIHLIVLFELIDFHGGAGVQQNDNLAEALLLDPADQIALVVGQREDVAGRRSGEFLRFRKAVLAGIEAGGFTGVTAEHDDGCILIAAEQGSIIFRNRNLADGSALSLIGVDNIAAGGTGRRIGGCLVLIEFDHIGVDREAFLGQGIRKRDGLRCLDQFTHGAAELHLFAAAHAEQGDVPAGNRRHSLQCDTAFRGGTGAVRDLRVNQVGGF